MIMMNMKKSPKDELIKSQLRKRMERDWDLLMIMELLILMVLVNIARKGRLIAQSFIFVGAKFKIE